MPKGGEDIGVTICSSDKGTNVNSKDHEPESRYGDAADNFGKCSKQINVNDAGSEAGNSRVKVKKIDDENKYARIKEGLKKFNIEGLVISGGAAKIVPFWLPAKLLDEDFPVFGRLV